VFPPEHHVTPELERRKFNFHGLPEEERSVIASLLERSEFELPVPVSKLPDDSIMLSFATSRRVVKRSHPGPHL
jgi:hypothetical protein